MKNFSKVEAWVASAAGRPCSEMAVGKNNRLTLGFGQGVPDPIQGLPNRKKYEWTIGAFFYTSWRVSNGETILCGSLDSKNRQEVGDKLNTVAVGSFLSIEVVSKFDIGVNFSKGIFIDFMSAASCDDTTLYIVGPGGFEAAYNYRNGWTLKRWSGPV